MRPSVVRFDLQSRTKLADSANSILGEMNQLRPTEAQADDHTRAREGIHNLPDLARSRYKLLYNARPGQCRYLPVQPRPGGESRWRCPRLRPASLRCRVSAARERRGAECLSLCLSVLATAKNIPGAGETTSETNREEHQTLGQREELAILAKDSVAKSDVILDVLTR